MQRFFRIIALVLSALMLCGCGKVDLSMQTLNQGEESENNVSKGSSDGSISASETTDASSHVETLFPESSQPESIYPLTDKSFVGCNAAICYNIGEDVIYYEKNADRIIYPASTTKLMTALTALRYSNEDTVFYVGSELSMVAQDSSRAWIAEGESYDRYAILAALLAPSGNDAAYTIAVNIGRDEGGADLSDTEAVDYFCSLMTKYAKELGCENTNFTVPDGYHSDSHYTTCRDMMKISAAAAQSSVIKDITSKPLIIVEDLDGYTHSWDNGNILLEDYTNPYTVFGLKTGYTDEAGFCFVGAAELDGDIVVTLTFDCDLEYRYSDTMKLMDLGFGLYDENKDYYPDYEE